MVICDDASGTCALTATVETPPPPVQINLKAEVPALQSLNSQSLADVTINQITYDVSMNTLNVDLPAVELFIAPAGVTSTSDPMAVPFGTVPPTHAGTTVTGGHVALTSQGQAAFQGYAHNFSTPFVFMGRTTVVLPGGTPTPTGAIKITVKGRLAAKPSSLL